MTQYPAEYRIRELSGTSGAVPWVLLAASLALVSHPPVSHRAVVPEVRLGTPSTLSTIGQLGSVFASVHSQPQTIDFEAAIGTFYSTLLASQELLGKEFERVLHENLWDLYVR